MGNRTSTQSTINNNNNNNNNTDIIHSQEEIEEAAAILQQQQQIEKENAEKRRRYAHLTSAAAATHNNTNNNNTNNNNNNNNKNIIEHIYEEDFSTIDHLQALRFPPMVVKEIKDAVASEAERRCAEFEKKMARCLQDKMWTSWKCQKERDIYFNCTQTEKEKNNNEMLTTYRWKYNLGTFHGEIIGRNNMMRRIWREHFPERDLPHPWVKDV